MTARMSLPVRIILGAIVVFSIASAPESPSAARENAACLVFDSADRSAASTASGFAPDEVVFKLRDSGGAARSPSEPSQSFLLQEITRTHGLAATDQLFPGKNRGALSRIHVARLPSGTSPSDAVKRLKEDPAVEWAEVNYRYYAQFVPNDSYYSSSGSWGQEYPDLWGLRALGPEDAWDLGQGSGIVVAVIDTGVDLAHEDLFRDANSNDRLDAGEQYNVWVNPGEDLNGNGVVDPEEVNGADDDGNGFVDDFTGWNFVSGNNSPIDDVGHGSHCAGIIAAVKDNGKGIVGVAPLARIMAVKALDANGSGTATALAIAIVYAADNNARVLSNSWGGSGVSQLISDAVAYARSRNCLVVASAGNSSLNAALTFPANLPGVLTVAALDPTLHRATFSNFGSVVGVSAPGVDVLSLRAAGTDMYHNGTRFVPSGDSNARYYRSDGTSMAAPFAAGLAALLLGRDPSLTETAARRAIAASTAPTATTNFYLGTGVLSMGAALDVLPQVSGVNAGISGPANDLDLLPTNRDLNVLGNANGDSYVLEYGAGYYPGAWTTISTGTSVTNGLLGTLDPSELQGPYRLRLTVNDGVRTAVEHTVFTAEPAIHPGWPIYLGGSSFYYGGYLMGASYTATPADADHDGKDEIFLGSSGHTFGLKGDGTFLPGWPTEQVEYASYGTNASMPGPSVADMNKDGTTEILWTLRDYAPLESFNGKHLDGSNVGLFPQPAIETPSNAMWMPFVLADLDADGVLEAVAAHTKGNNDFNYRFSAFDHAGSRLFTHDLPDVNESFVGLCFGDMDNDGQDDLVGVSRAGYQNAPIYLHLFDGNGDEQPGYPVFLYNQVGTETVSGPPFLADLDHDGDLEVILGISSGTSRIRAYHHNGTAVAGFPKVVGNAIQIYHYSMGDVTGDEAPEIIVLANRNGSFGVYALSVGGAVLTGFPFVLSEQPTGTPAVVDVDNDGRQDIVFTTYQGSVYAVSGIGALVAGYPKKMSFMSTSGASVGDIDGDGLFELVTATMIGGVYVWDLPTPASAENASWPMRNINSSNTSVYAVPPAPVRASGPSPADGETAVDTATTLQWTAGSGTVSHDVFFGTVNPPPFLTNQSTTSLDPGVLDSNTTYYWRVNERNAAGATTGPIWSFTTVDPNDPPVANAGPDLTGMVGQALSFSGAASTDVDGSIVSCSWNWGDGTAHGSGTRATHVYRTSGTKTVTLTVTDDAGATATDVALATVKPSTNLALYKPAKASSTGGRSAGAKAVDGRRSTSWISRGTVGAQWLRVDLGAPLGVSNVRILWRAASYAKAFRIETSIDGMTWRRRYSTSSARGIFTNAVFPRVTARYVRMYGLIPQNLSFYGVEELKVYR